MLVLLAGLLLASPAFAGDDEGLPLTVRVLDAAGAPVIGAVVRSPLEEDRHRTNTATGAWTGNALYPANGEPIFFVKGMDVSFEVTAPGYVSETVHYVVRKRRNVLEVRLTSMDLADDRETPDDPIIGFRRDVPRDGLTPVEGQR